MELTNERMIGADIVASANLSSSMRNRFTRVVSAATVTITLVAYTGIVTGSEHELFNAGMATVTVAAGTGITIRSVSSKLNISSYGAAVAKYLGSSTFALIGALE